MISPYELLVGLALLREKKRLDNGAQQGQKPLEAWTGLLVRIGSTQCVIRQDEVDEVIPPTGLTKVLGMPPWMLGVGYFRGQLLNVIDAQSFFFGKRHSIVSPASRILVVQGQEEWFGLRIDELGGIRYIWSDSTSITLISEDMEHWKGYVEQCIEVEHEIIPMLQVKRLMDSFEQRGIPDNDAVNT